MRDITEAELEQVSGGDIVDYLIDRAVEAAREALRRLAGPNV